MQIEFSEFRELLTGGNGNGGSASITLKEGTPIYIRGAVYSWCGICISQDSAQAWLQHASYVGTDGRYSRACKEGFPCEGAETEFAGDITIAKSMIVDFVEIPKIPES